MILRFASILKNSLPNELGCENWPNKANKLSNGMKRHFYVAVAASLVGGVGILTY